MSKQVEPSALINEVAERIIQILDSDFVLTWKDHGGKALYAAVGNVLADFKKAIELQGYGAVMAAEPGLAKLTEEARAMVHGDKHDVIPSGRKTIKALVTALEQQIAARQATEERLRRQAETAKTALVGVRDYGS